jgi:Flp pilus assembly protein TadG
VSAIASSRRRRSGQALVEFSIVLPLFLIMLFGIIDFGRVVWANSSLANAAREGARYAIVHAGGSRQSTKDAAAKFAFAGGTGVTVTVCYGAGCTGDTDVAGAEYGRGTAVTVTVSSTVTLVSASMLGMQPFTVAGTSTMLVNN